MIWTKEQKEDFLNLQMKTISGLGGDMCGMRKKKKSLIMDKGKILHVQF